MDVAELGRGASLDQVRFGHLIGVPRSTIENWLNRERTDAIERFVFGLERLSEGERIEFLRSICRPCPRLTQLKISHDVATVNALRALLAQRSGAIIISGGTPSERTFLLTALGHHFVCLKNIAGIDIHQPARFVPVPGVFYPNQRLTSSDIPLIRATILPAVFSSTAPVLLFNGIESILAAIRNELLHAVDERLVLIAGAKLSGFSPLKSVSKIHILNTSAVRWTLRIAAASFLKG